MKHIEPVFLNAVNRKGEVTRKDIFQGIKFHDMNNYDGIVAVGAMVRDALKKLGIDHFYMPHPSGRNYLLNDPEYVENKLNELREYINGRR